LGNKLGAKYCLVILFGFALLFPGAAFQSAYGHIISNIDDCTPVKVEVKITNISINWWKPISHFNDWIDQDGEVSIDYVFSQIEHEEEGYGTVSNSVYIGDWKMPANDDVESDFIYTELPLGKKLPKSPLYSHATCLEDLSGKTLNVTVMIRELDGVLGIGWADEPQGALAFMAQEVVEAALQHGSYKFGSFLGKKTVSSVGELVATKVGHVILSVS